MKNLKNNCALALIIAGMLAIGQATADKPAWADSGKGGKGEHRDQSDGRKGGQRDSDDRSSRDHAGRGGGTGEHHFGDRHRTAVRDYYSEQHRRGFCPPGLAKKDNGCQPPGQTKKWTAGRPLPRDVVFHDLPPSLVRQFNRPPAGQRYVRVGSDILLIGNGTGTVFDAIPNLGRM